MIKTLSGWMKMESDYQDKPTWIFVNKDSGTLIEHTNLGNLLFELSALHGLELPQHIEVDLMLYKRVDIKVKDIYGNEVNIALGEHHPNRNIYFEKQ